jgi:hypothetical protein
MNRFVLTFPLCALAAAALAVDFPKPYDKNCTERENVFSFTEKPSVELVGKDKYQIAFAVKGYCDVTVGIIDKEGKVVRHVASGVLGRNAPPPFQKNSLAQKIYWDGKNDLEEYPKETGELRVRVALGLKPTFDKRLGPCNPKDIPGRWLAGVAIDEDGVYVFGDAKRRYHLRKFDHDGKYVSTPFPPPAGLPLSKLQGMGGIEWAPGKTAVHGPDLIGTCSSGIGNYTRTLPSGFALYGHPVIVNNRFYYVNVGGGRQFGSMMFYLKTDGTAETLGMRGCPLIRPNRQHHLYRLAASPDGKWIYMTGVDSNSRNLGAPDIYRLSTSFTKPAELFLGGKGVGSDKQHFNGVDGIACDAQGRICVCDVRNNRLQIFNADGSWFGTIPLTKPRLVCIHRRTKAVYVAHVVRTSGRAVGRLSKLASLTDPRVVAHVDGIEPFFMALDSWTEKPRLWLGVCKEDVRQDKRPTELVVWEERGKTFEKIIDFHREAAAAYGPGYFRWGGSMTVRPECDPVREQVYLGNGSSRGSRIVFDLNTGRHLFTVLFTGAIDDCAFDKRGYMHQHFSMGWYEPGVGREDPSQPQPQPQFVVEKYGGDNVYRFAEVPYDYGTAPPRNDWIGVLPVKDQPGAKFFQDGIGVNMRGDVAEECNIYYVPKMEEHGRALLEAGLKAETEKFGFVGGYMNRDYNNFLKDIKEKEKQGITTYSITRRPGIPLCGGTVWTFDRSGELRAECAAIVGRYINGVQIDEEGRLYFVFSYKRLYNGHGFLDGCGRIIGGGGEGYKALANPFTGVLAKTRGKDVRLLLDKNAPLPLDELPKRPPDVVAGYTPWEKAWLEGAQWLYAGAAIVPCGCSCPTTRFCTDWYKRSFVSEQYRHSIGVIDGSGNLVLHVGEYGNYDSADGPKSKIPVGGDGIAITHCSFVSATDNYLVFEDEGTRLTALKLNYAAEESVPIGMK